MYYTIQQIKKANKALRKQNKGGYWFSAGTMRFFGTYVMPRVYHGRYFITSEQPPHSPRVYSIRRAEDDGDINTVGEIGGYATEGDAIKAVKAMEY